MQGIKQYIIAAMFSLFVFVPSVAGAANLQDQIMDQVGVSGVEAQLTADPDGEQIDPRSVIAGIIQVLLSLLGIIFLILMIAGGYRYMTAEGDDGRLQSGKDTIRNAIIGLILTLAAYSITTYILIGFQRAVSEGDPLPGEERVDLQENSERIGDELNERVDEFFR